MFKYYEKVPYNVASHSLQEFLEVLRYVLTAL